MTEVALIPYCEECRELWLPGDEQRRPAYRIDNGPEDAAHASRSA